MARLASYPTYPCVGAGPSELGSEFSKRSRHLGKDKRSSRTPHTSHFLVDPSHGSFCFLEMLRSPIKIAPRCLLKFGQRAKFAWNKKKTTTNEWTMRDWNWPTVYSSRQFSNHVTNEHSTNQSYSLKLSRWLWIEFPRASLDTDMTKSPGISRDFYNFPASDILPKHR